MLVFDGAILRLISLNKSALWKINQLKLLPGLLLKLRNFLYFLCTIFAMKGSVTLVGNVPCFIAQFEML